MILRGELAAALWHELRRRAIAPLEHVAPDDLDPEAGLLLVRPAAVVLALLPEEGEGHPRGHRLALGDLRKTPDPPPRAAGDGDRDGLAHLALGVEVLDGAEGPDPGLPRLARLRPLQLLREGVRHGARVQDTGVEEAGLRPQRLQLVVAGHRVQVWVVLAERRDELVRLLFLLGRHLGLRPPQVVPACLVGGLVGKRINEEACPGDNLVDRLDSCVMAVRDPVDRDGVSLCELIDGGIDRVEGSFD
mmetsp:Transcript_29472/g.83050  ORF Transcript_29472/g.83050 Transcript_29472/m.83050 type:complete len:247 (+) Transcript_29472:659-1399(+)